MYDFASTKQDSEHCCVLPCFTLALTCRQIREEFRKICLRAPVTVDWRDLPKYLDTFYPSIDSRLQNIENAPASIVVNADVYTYSTGPVTIDLLPLLKFSHAQASFTCHFQYSTPKRADVPEPNTEDKEYLHCDSTTVQRVIQHDNTRWKNDVQSGTVARISVSPIGLTSEPEMHLYLLHNEETRQFQADGDVETIDELGEQYITDVELYKNWSEGMISSIEPVYFQVHRVEATAT